ncbi:MAG TPA: hypothetical protein VJ836_00850 [Candidatus Saccharimonadales bacterium]|nr:hypothetical protein [Candidatus Saccharimonadales bacterium]
MLARRDYSIACQTPSRNLIGIYAGVWLWWCSTHYQPEMYCREAKAKNSIEPAVLEAELRRMKPRQQVYELIKRDMQRRGRWKLKDRGAPPPAKT